MTIEILQTIIIQDENGLDDSRTATISITDGIDTYLWPVGGLPLAGDLQTILDAREAKLFQVASAKGVPFDVFEIAERRVLKALALVLMDELNILRGQHGLTLRDESQIRGAIKNKLKSI